MFKLRAPYHPVNENGADVGAFGGHNLQEILTFKNRFAQANQVIFSIGQLFQVDGFFQ